MVSAIVLLTACGAEGENAAKPIDSSTPPSATVTPTASGAASPSTQAAVPAALRFTATTLTGATFDGTALAGKPVVFWFWAPWCPKCLSGVSAVKAAVDKYKDVAFVGVAGLDTENAMKAFVQRTGTDNLVHLSDEKGVVWTKLEVSTQSTFVFMRPDGSTTKASGPLGSGELDGHVDKLVAG